MAGPVFPPLVTGGAVICRAGDARALEVRTVAKARADAAVDELLNDVRNMDSSQADDP
jgi:hypothetical protein